MRARLVQSAVVFLALLFTAASVPTGTAEQTGLAPDRLQRIHEVMQRYIDAGQISGAVTLVARRGRVAHLEAHGLMDLESRKPMAKDAIFRLASTSKPVTAVAVLMLVEEGKIRLTDPVSRFIPEFKSMKVAMPRPGAQPAPAAGGRRRWRARRRRRSSIWCPPRREITIKDLLTHGSGSDERRTWRDAGGAHRAEGADGHARPTTSRNSAAVPLDFQPGTAWRYSGIAGFEVLSRVVEVASGQPFDQFLQKRLFDPLGMKDTGFWFPDDRLARRVTLYQRMDNKLTRSQGQDGLSSKVYFSGAGGLMSTVEDYLQFAQMLVNGGTLNGKRLLGPRTVELMSNGTHAGELFAANPGRGGMGFGLGVDVVQDLARANRITSVGSFGWDGAYGTHFWVDAKEQMVGIMFINTATPGLARDFETAVMQAVVN